MRDWIVTVDGGAASGKSAVSKQVAKFLGVPYISTGLFYRALAVLALRHGLDVSQQSEVAQFMDGRFQLRAGVEDNRVFWDGEDLTSELHTSAVDACVSVIAQHPQVRDWVTRVMQSMQRPFVAEGRDMGTAVFPNAQMKFYLTASPEVRARRRSAERPEDIQSTLVALLDRDRQDALQSRPADDARVIDTSELSLEEVVRQILSEVRGVLCL